MLRVPSSAVRACAALPQAVSEHHAFRYTNSDFTFERFGARAAEEATMRLVDTTEQGMGVETKKKAIGSIASGLVLGSAMIAADEFPWRGCSRCRTYDFDRGRSVPEAWVQPLSYLRFPCLNLPSHDFEKVNLENVF